MWTRNVRLQEQAEQLRSGRQDLMTAIEEACDWVERAEPALAALLPEEGRRERLRKEALSLQRRYPDPADHPPLYGVLFAVKDLFHVHGFPTRAGSQLPAEVLSGPQASSVTLLREAGALVLGKAVSAEFAYFEPGPTRNPVNPLHTPGGSSSGSAAAVAAGYCPLALGTQTIGSVLRPAAFCGIVGFKPTFGRISADGLILCAPSLDTVGLFTQDIAGMMQVASLLCRGWRGCPSLPLPVLGVPEGPYLDQTSPEGLRAFEEQLARLQRAGYRLKRVPALPDIASINQRHLRLVHAEMARVHARWFERFAALYRPLTAAAIREGVTIGIQEIVEVRAGREILRTQVQALMEREGIDLWLTPAAPGPAPQGLQTTGSGLMNLPWTQAGLPALSLPAGRAKNGLPLGLQCVAGWMRDEELLAWAAALETALAEQA
ncbi:amidase [Thermogemmatispora aurantia]|uniref:Amidase n=2 Tax=Thermogemmatispora TaxID=768669 RepID=A0A5J4K577_9CHLR|nr:amidase [Thermogemmatispora aurantia]GER81829.1 amidase [Thermogemmatispora aurantia]